MANTLQTSQMIVNELLLQFKNSIGLGRLVNREFEKKFGIEGAKIGDSVDLRDPVLFTVGDGEEVTPQSIQENVRRLTLNVHKHVAWECTSKEMTLDIDQWMERHGNSAVMQLGNEVDRHLTRLAYQASGIYLGTPGTAVSSFKTFNQAKAKLEAFGAPPTKDLLMIVGPDTQVEAVDLAKGLFHSDPQIKRQYEDGNMLRANGLNWHSSQNVRRHTVGALGGTPLVNGAGQTGSSIITDGWTAAVANRLAVGDSITFASSYAVNPITKETLSFLRPFVVTQIGASDGSGNMTIQISPDVITTGPYQNVSVGPANNDVIQIFGHASSHASVDSEENICMHPSAITLAVAPLYTPRGMDYAATAYDEGTGLGISFLRDMDVKTRKLITRVDILFGAAVTHNEWICRVLGA